MELPTTCERVDLLRQCLAWVGKNYVGGTVAESCRTVVRSVLGLPLDDRPVTRCDFTRASHLKAMVPYGEVLRIGALAGPDPDQWEPGDQRLAGEICTTLLTAVKQPDLNEAQYRQVHVECMVAGLERWLTESSGGLADAVKALSALASGGWSPNSLG